MLRIYLCTVHQHEHWLVALAALICLATTVSGTLLFRKAQEPQGLRWLLAAGGATGFGIWATHFVAMMGYMPGIAVSYRPWPTASSLMLAMVLITAGFHTARQRRGMAGACLAAAITGCGVAAMHYLGVLALAMPAIMRFDPVYVTASVVLAIAPMIPAFHLAQARRGIAASCALLTLAVVCLHFTGMAAIELIPSRQTTSGVILLSPRAMTVLVSAAAGMVLLICGLALLHARRVQDIVKANARDLSIIINGVTDYAVYMLTLDGRVKNWNDGAGRLKGYSHAEAIGLPLDIFYTPEDRAAGLPRMELDAAAQQGKFASEGWRRRKDGSIFWAHTTIQLVIDGESRALGFAKITRDMTRAKQDQDRLADMKAQLDTALDNMHQGLALFDARQRLVLCNDRLFELWGLDPRDLKGAALEEILPLLVDGARAAAPAQVHALLEQSMKPAMADTATLECRPDLILSIATRPLTMGGWVSTFEDITLRRQSEARIAHLAMHDPLTGLANRAHFAEQCGLEMDHAARHDRDFGMVIIDMDGFKEINDTWGHAEGDRTISEIARRLKECCGEGEMIARMGGDEFAAGKSFAAQAELSDFLERLNACFTEAIPANGHEIPVGASFGVAIFPADGANLESLMNNADLAMYRAKNGLDENICHYQPGMDETARTRRQMAADLRQAVERDEFHLLYQPQYSISDNRLTGYEALLRWFHPVRGLVSPLDFIPIAEETGSIFAIGEWVLQEAAREAADWSDDLKIAVNLSPVQLQQPDLIQKITEILLDTGLPARRLELEITESAIIADKARALHMLRQIKALGITIAMDDFGTGYSSLDTLHSFPFDKIKIDQSFLLKSSASHQATAIVRAVLALGRSLEIPVLAEGVETEEQLALLIREGCSEAQGFYYGRPQLLKHLPRKAMR